jgi:hypothetical protein
MSPRVGWLLSFKPGKEWNKAFVPLRGLTQVWVGGWDRSLEFALATKSLKRVSSQRAVARKNLRVRRFGVQFLTLELSRFSARWTPGGVRGADRRLSPDSRTVKRFCLIDADRVTDKKNWDSLSLKNMSELESGFLKHFQTRWGCSSLGSTKKLGQNDQFCNDLGFKSSR